ncbi:MAG: M23 family metallopeptidase [Gammaproteobacteria bacterium]|nr:M23 family metallopeptidase [Gammaproteobacteria bacterium]MDH5728806.1 M23 family metallopeptidase [Gammaproteobacteria bacterium]
MSVILVTSRSGRTKKIHFGSVQMTLLGVAFCFIIAGAVYLGMQNGQSKTRPLAMVSVMQKELEHQNHELNSVTLAAEENMNALAVRLGQMQAHVIRLDALGERLIEKAKLSRGEFDFRSSPGQGGPSSSDSNRGEAMTIPDFIRAMGELDQQIEHRSLQLGVLETMLMNRELQDEVYPAGRPVRRGWVSSYYGFRTDPFNGRIAHHDGIDIAGKEGSEIIAVAAGVVTWAGRRYGYGNLVEVNHGNGYVTRYAHNKDVLVNVGTTVKKGHVLAQMGSSGRSTGPHVHFEVIKNGRVVDPMKYIRASR